MDILSQHTSLYFYSNIHLCVVLDNIAQYKPTMQSSDYDGLHKSERAVDGNADPNFYSYHCNCTGESYEPWWAVDSDL